MAARESRLAEVVAAFTLTTDLATGQPLEHGLRRTLLAIWLGAEAGLDDDQLRDAYYVALLGSAGCVLDSAAMARFLEDDIAFRANMFPLDMASPMVAARYFGGTVVRGRSPIRQAAKMIGLTTQSKAICRDVATGVGAILDLGPQVRHALGQCDEHWNGKSAVLGLKGEQISVHARLFLLAQDIEVFHRLGGEHAAIQVVHQRSGTYYDPQLATCFIENASELLARLQVASTWDAARRCQSRAKNRRRRPAPKPVTAPTAPISHQRFRSKYCGNVAPSRPLARNSAISAATVRDRATSSASRA